MSERWIAAVAWIGFFVLVGSVAELMLTACDIGPHPLLARRYCSEPAAFPLAAEQARERDLRDRLHAAQLAINRLPVCLPSPEHRAEVVPAPSPAPSATPTPTPDQRLTIPRNVNDLNGCWQSVQGDIPTISADKDHRVVAHRRICYCFSGNGEGEARETLLEGGSCTGPLKIRISGQRLIISHETLPCTDAKNSTIVPTDIICSKKPDADFASCDRTTRGNYPIHFKDEVYHRVSEDYCK